jgi:Zn-dependent protease with chaperone function/RNA polymerase subunit RPABC4/transcription elongation factor Spt4
MPQTRIRFPLISSEAFVAQTDKAALQNLQKLPLLPMLMRKFNEFAVDRVFYAQNSAESVRCGPKQFPTLYEMMRESCAILHIPEPELYVRYDHVYNAYTAGVNRTFITLHSALVEDFTDDEILYIIGHETGHIKCGHVLYNMLGRMLLPLLEALGQVTLGLGQLAGIGVVSAFFEWMRQAEYSCDRAGMLVCQDPRVAFTATMKLGAGSTRFDHEMDVDTFLEQARQHADSAGAEGLTKALLFVMYNWQLTHPQVVYRAKGLDEWHRSGAYDTIMSGQYIRDATGGSQLGSQIRCPQCKTMLSATVQHCPQCGYNVGAGQPAPTAATGATKNCMTCHATIPAGVNFCPHCGQRAA